MEQKNSSGRTVYLTGTPYPDAQEKFLSAFARPYAKEECLPVSKCLGRITSRPVFARLSSPHYHASAMDGIAVHSADTSGARETRPVVLRQGEQAFWVDTGDPLPAGTNSVVMVEEVHDRGEGHLEIVAPVAPWENVRVDRKSVV